jgi:hypothetical protein
MTRRTIPTEYRPQRRRVDRDNRPALAWQSRDTDLLLAALDNRWMTRDLFLLLFPPGEAPAHIAGNGAAKQPGTNLDRRLAKLFHHGFLHRSRTEYAGPLIYALTNAGAVKLAEELTRRQEETGADYRGALAALATRSRDESNRTAKAGTIDHALAIARLRVSLAAATRGTRLAIDKFQREGEDLKADWKVHGGGRRYVIPDAFLILKDESEPAGRQCHAFFVEIDRSTMPAVRMADKFARYSDLYRDGMHQIYYRVPTFRVLTVCKSAERAENLRRLVRGEFTAPHHTTPHAPAVPANHRSFFYFIHEAAFTDPIDLLTITWTRADDNATPATPAHILPRPLARGSSKR